MASDYRQEISPNAQEFRFEPSLGWLLLGGCIFFLGAAALSIALLMRDAVIHRITGLLGTPIFFLAALLTLRSFLRLRYSVAVNDEGLWHSSAGRATTFIAWNDVKSVVAEDVQQRLVIAGKADGQKIRLDYQLKDFEKLRQFIRDQIQAKAHLTEPSVRSFHRTWINKVILLSFAATGALLVRWCLQGGQRAPALCFGGMSLYLLLSVLFADPTRVTTSEEGVLIHYPMRKRVIPFSAIKAIELKDVRESGNAWAAVIIKTQSGRSVKFFRFREGSIAMQEALEEAWRLARGGQVVG